MTNAATRTDETRVLEILDEYLTELRAGRAPDRATLLEKHPDLAPALAASLRALDFVHDAGRVLDVEGASDASDGEELPPSGRILGDYRLLREIGRGGMAVVYEAEQLSLGRSVALKVLPFAAVLDPKHLQRFKNEAHAAAHLHHPHIVPVYAVGCERGVHYYAMQYVEGQSLAVAIRERRIGSTGEGTRTPISSHGSHREPAYIRMAAVLGLQAAEALDHAHQLGIVHRDVKPGNLLVGVSGKLSVTDFGLALSLKDAGLTITGELLGTIRYMSPEQAQAKRVPIDHRTDIYSLGVTLYELLTLEPAFPGDDPHRLLQDIAQKEPVSPRRLNPALPRDLETVLLKAMSKDPGSRYATAQEMADDLARYLENRAIEAKRRGPLRRLAKWGGRHRALVGAATGVLLLAVAGLAISSALLWREKERTSAAFQRAESNLTLALQALDEIYMNEAEGHPTLRQGLPRDLLERGLGFYEAFVRENTQHNRLVGLLLGLAYQRAGLIYRELGQEAGAVQALERAITAYDRAIEVEPRSLLASHNRGIALSDLGRFEEALAAHERTLAIAPRDADAHNSRGALLCDQLGRPGEALEEFLFVIELDPRSAEAHNHRGNALRRLKRFEEALGAYDRALELDSRNATAHLCRGVVLGNDLGKLVEALAEFDLAIELGPPDSRAHVGRGNMFRLLRRFDEALAACHRALEINSRSVIAHSCRGDVLADVQRFEEALAAYAEALEIEPRNVQVHACRGDLLQDLGRFEEALAVYGRSVEIDPRYAEGHCGRGNALRSLGRFEEALAAHERAIAIDPKLVAARNGRGNALVGLSRFEEALAAYDQALALDARTALVHHNRGEVLCDHLDRPEEALAEFDLAIELDPLFAATHYDRGCALSALGRFEEALAAYDHALALVPPATNAHSGRGNALQELGRFEEALAACDRALAIDQRSARNHQLRGNALRELGRLEEALEACDRALAIDPQHCRAYIVRGNALQGLKRFDEALADFTRSVQLDPQSAVGHHNRGNALRNLNRPEEALVSYGRSISIDPRNAFYHYGLAGALSALGKVEAAIGPYREAIYLAPNFYNAHYNLAGVLYLQGDVGGAIASYRDAICLEPNRAEAHGNLGFALYKNGDPHAAVEEYRLAIRLHPSRAEAHVNLGNAYMAIGDVESAIGAYRQSIQLKPDGVGAHYSLAEALGAKGDREGAIAALRDAVSFDPQDAALRFSLGNALAATDDSDAAIASFQEAIRLQPDHAKAHCNLGLLLLRQGRSREALRSLRKGHQIGSKQPHWAYPSKQWIAEAERECELEERQERLLSGAEQPRDTSELVEFAEMLYERSRYAPSMHFWALAFAADATLAEDLVNRNRYNAACSAAQAAARGGEDAAACRGRALEWLSADLAARHRATTGLAATLERWKRDPDLASVRDRLGDLPEAEREAWQKLWVAVDEALATARQTSR